MASGMYGFGRHDNYPVYTSSEFPLGLYDNKSFAIGELIDLDQPIDVGRNSEDFAPCTSQEYAFGDSKIPDLLTDQTPCTPEPPPRSASDQEDLLIDFEDEKVTITPLTTTPLTTIPLPSMDTLPLLPPMETLPPMENMIPPEVSSQPADEPILDPTHPTFNVELFKIEMLGTYKCPHKYCK